MSKLQMKKMIITFCDIKNIVHFEFLLQGQRVNQSYYVEILKRLREAVLKKIHLNFGPAIEFPTVTTPQLTRHSLSSSFWLLAQKSITDMENPPSSSDLAPSDFCFQK
jgi:hypothetical protein